MPLELTNLNDLAVFQTTLGDRRRLQASRRIRRAISRVKAKTARATILCVGDSTNANLVETGGRAASWPTAFAARLSDLGIPAIAESICGEAGSAASYAAYNPQVNLGAWSYDGAKVTAGGYMFRVDTTGPVFTYTPVTNVDTFEISSIQFTSGQGSVGVAIGGSVPATGLATISANGGSQALVTNIVKASTATLAALTLTKTVAAPFLLAGIKAYNSAVSAIDVVNAGWSGSASANWDDATAVWSPINVIKAYAADLVIINLGVNDWNGGVDVASYTAHILALIVAAKSVNSDVMLVGPVQSNPAGTGTVSAAIQQTFIDAIVSLAYNNGCLYEERYTRNGTWAEAFANGMAYNDKHGSLIENKDFGGRIASVLAGL